MKVARLVPSSKAIAWMAGIWEGEGSIFRRSSGGTITVSVSQKDRWILDRLQSWVGGSICNPSNTQPCYQWHIYGARALGFILTIYLFLSPRRKEQIYRVTGIGGLK